MPTRRRLFSGTSKQGNFEEALDAAIAAAKTALRSTFVKWTLAKVSGENGGIVPQNDLTVQIAASVPSARGKKPAATPRRRQFLGWDRRS